MTRFYRFLLLAGAFLMVSTACSLPGNTTPIPDIAQTSIAQTVIADLTKMVLPSANQPLATITPTFEPTFTAIFTETPLPLFTATPVIPVVSVSVDTNCRVGPGRAYGRVGGLLVGQLAEVLGRSQNSDYWYIRLPGTNTTCWLWGEYATLSGPVQFLPIFTPPPTPTATSTPIPTATTTPQPGFTAKYDSLDSCGGNFWADINLKNNGSITFRSMEIRVVDKDTNVTMTSLVNGFTNLDGCLGTTQKDAIEPGKKFTISTPQFSSDLSGHKLRVTITLCSKTGQDGSCVTEVIVFTP